MKLKISKEWTDAERLDVISLICDTIIERSGINIISEVDLIDRLTTADSHWIEKNRGNYSEYIEIEVSE